MLADKSKPLIIYGAVLIVLGLAAVMFVPETGFGFNKKAISGLIVGLLGGGLAVAFGMLARAGKNWAITAGLVLAFALLVMCSHRAFLGWRQVNAGYPEKRYAAVLVSLMALASLITAVSTARGAGSARIESKNAGREP
jgi:hypothetical protein